MPRRRKTVADEVIFIFEQSVDYIIYQRRINNGTIRGNANDHICLRLLRGLIITVKHIVETAARKRDSAEVTVFRDRVVRRVSRRGEHCFGNSSSPRSPDEDALQHRLTRDVREDLPR